MDLMLIFPDKPVNINNAWTLFLTMHDVKVNAANLQDAHDQYCQWFEKMDQHNLFQKPWDNTIN